MRLVPRRRPRPPDMNMTPMIDVVFQLLIFFMTCYQVSEVNRSPVELPREAGSVDQPEQAVTINVDQTGQILIAGDRRDLTDVVKLMAAELSRAGDDPHKLRVVLRVDRRATCRTANEIVTELTRLQIRKVGFAVQSEERQ